MHPLWPLLLPELERFPPPEQPAALERARRTDMDWVELLGIAFALVLVTWITEHAPPAGVGVSRAIPVFAGCAGIGRIESSIGARIGSRPDEASPGAPESRAS